MDALRFMGDIVFTDLATGSIKKVDNTTIASGFYVPTGLAAMGDDLYAADWASGMVWHVYGDGKQVMKPVATGLSGPEGLTVDIDGNLLAVEGKAGRLSRVDVDTGTVSLVADNLALGYPAISGFPPTWVFNGVDVGPSGNIFVTGDITNVLYCIKATERVISTIDDLPEEVFRSGRHQRIFKKFIGVSQNLIDKGKYRSARAMMEFLRRRTDGTGKDWIVNPAAQQAMTDLLDMQIASLSEQIED
jgi:hypothetical protein